jgi:hypothetical protein
MIAYHVCGSIIEGDLLSLYALHGEAAYDMYIERWADSGNLGQYHAHWVHLYDNLADAIKHQHELGGYIYQVDLSELDYRVDTLEFPHPMVRDSIPSWAISLLK